MAGARKPGPQCAFNDPVDIEDGTSYRAASPAPGPLGADLGHDRVSGGSHKPGDVAKSLLSAWHRAVELAPGAVHRETGYLLGEIPGLFHGFQVLIAGGDPGAGAGSAILPSLGVGFLREAIGDGLEEMLSPLRKGIAAARHAGNGKGPDRTRELDRAGEELARAIAVLVRLILQGMVRARNSVAGSAESRTKALEQLRSSDLASGFAAWVEKNWDDLVQNPRLKPRLRVRNLLGSTEELETASQVPPRKAADEEEPRTWVAVRLVDSDGKPVPGQRYKIQLPDSSIEEGTLDADGSVRFNNLLPGQCQVRFPDIHGDEWTPA